MKELTKNQIVIAVIIMTLLLSIAILVSLEHTFFSLIVIGVISFIVDAIASIISDKCKSYSSEEIF